MNKSDPSPTQGNSNLFPLRVEHTFAISTKPAAFEKMDNANSLIHYDGVQFDFSQSSIDISGATWDLTVHFYASEEDGMTYTVELSNHS